MKVVSIIHASESTTRRSKTLHRSQQCDLVDGKSITIVSKNSKGNMYSKTYRFKLLENRVLMLHVPDDPRMVEAPGHHVCALTMFFNRRYVQIGQEVYHIVPHGGKPDADVVVSGRTPPPVPPPTPEPSMLAKVGTYAGIFGLAALVLALGG